VDHERTSKKAAKETNNNSGTFKLERNHSTTAEGEALCHMRVCLQKTDSHKNKNVLLQAEVKSSLQMALCILTEPI